MEAQTLLDGTIGAARRKRLKASESFDELVLFARSAIGRGGRLVWK